MITTKTNLRATATEAYDKGHRDGSDAVRSLDQRVARSRGRREGEQAVRALVLQELRQQHEAIHLALGKAETRWEKRLLVGRLEGVETALKIVASQA
jgi:hypothetical protein